MKTQTILLLHGSRQTGDLLLGRMDKLRKRLKKNHNLHIVAPTAAFVHPADELVRQWWNREGDAYHGLVTTTLPQLLQVWQAEDADHEFVGILGFSQGARLAHLCCLAHAAQPDRFFPGLRFAIQAAGYEATIPDDFLAFIGRTAGDAANNNNNIATPWCRVPTLHVWGRTDAIITPAQSEAVLPYYTNPESHIHEGGHHVPMRAASVQAYEDFIQRVMSKSNESAQQQQQPAPAVPDEETAQIQMDEVAALSAIYPEEIHMISKFTSDSGDDNDLSNTEDKTFEYPINYRIDLVESDDGWWPPKPLALDVEYPIDYPTTSLPILRLVHENNVMEFSSAAVQAVTDAAQEAAQAEEGMPCILSCLYAVRELLESGTLKDISSSSSPTTPSNDAEEKDRDNTVEETNPASNDPDSALPNSQLLRSSSEKRIEECLLHGLEIAKDVLDLMASSSSGTAGDDGGMSLGKGGSWAFTIGLVGKPSAGKSTFFNAATAFARQRDDSDNWLGGATMAPHPFTTIDPNVGYCLVPAPQGSCPEDDESFHTEKSKVGNTHGRDTHGRRLVPVLLKDVAGLVPGAYQGRGRGNQFLNDLTDADVLVHVLDSSGLADTEGNSVGAAMDDQPPSEASHPLQDMAWIRKELVQWVYSNLLFKWDVIRRKGRPKLTEMFGGYGQNQAVTIGILDAVERAITTREGREHALNHVQEWDEGDVYRLVSAFLGVRFPMVLALNKCDLPSSAAHVKAIQDALPIHGAHAGVPLSARKEMNFMRLHLERALNMVNESSVPTESEKQDGGGPEGVWRCLQSGINLRGPLLVFPVAELVNYSSLPGLFKSATTGASLPSHGMISCLRAAGGEAPSLWSDKTSSYLTAPNQSSKSWQLRDCLMMKRGSTVDDVFQSLKRLGALSGEFVRAEATSSIGEPSRPVPKSQKLNRSNRILKIMTNKKAT